MTNPLEARIQEIVKDTPEMRRLTSQILPTLGSVTYYNEDTRRVAIQYVDPVNGNLVDIEEVDISKVGNVHGTVSIGDFVLICFLSGSQTAPVVACIIPKQDYVERIAGSYTTKISGGI
jgi:formylmethanofuran dehydrogenase subunit E-like metal-binding protein